MTSPNMIFSTEGHLVSGGESLEFGLTSDMKPIKTEKKHPAHHQHQLQHHNQQQHPQSPPRESTTATAIEIVNASDLDLSMPPVVTATEWNHPHYDNANNRRRISTPPTISTPNPEPTNLVASRPKTLKQALSVSHMSSASARTSIASQREMMATRLREKDEQDDDGDYLNDGGASGNFNKSMIIKPKQLDDLRTQGFPLGLAQELCKAKASFPVRFWVIDNSGSMLTSDGNELRDSTKTGYLVVPCTRWAELKGTVLYHIRLSSLCQSTTLFRFLNNPGARVGPQEFSIADPDFQEEDGITDVQLGTRVVNNVAPKGATPLSDHLQDIRLRVEAMHDELVQSGQSVAIILATDGLPSNQYGDSTEQVQLEFIANLKALQALPVWIVVRLCTDDEDVVNYYNDLDSSLELPIEVIDDYLGEAKEIQKANPWLNYAIPLHRCREMGYHHRIFDLLDERLLNKDELKEFLQVLFGKNALDGFPDAYQEWRPFCKKLTKFLEQEEKHYNPLAKKATPWIDTRLLEKSLVHNSNSNNNSNANDAPKKMGRRFFFRRRSQS